jgi:hypothetical protein
MTTTDANRKPGKPRKSGKSENARAENAYAIGLLDRVGARLHQMDTGGYPMDPHLYLGAAKLARLHLEHVKGTQSWFDLLARSPTLRDFFVELAPAVLDKSDLMAILRGQSAPSDGSAHSA